MDMKLIELDNGRHKQILVEEPTYIKAKNPWKAIVGGDWMNFGINAYAPVIVEGVRIFGSRRAFHLKPDTGFGILKNCWIYNNHKGVLAEDRLMVDHCLIEYNGCHPSYGHGIYWKDDLFMSNSIVRHNTGFQLHGYVSHADDRKVFGQVMESLIYAGTYKNNAIADRGKTCFHSCTIFGRLDISDPKIKNMLINDHTNIYDEEVDHNLFVDSQRGVFWPVNNDGKGCYEYNENATIELAKQIFPGVSNGWMYYDGYEIEFNPHFPGDPLPGV